MGSTPLGTATPQDPPVASAGVHRCGWCTRDPLYIAYHDNEWGVPSHDDRHLFEMLILEGAQAGLSWMTILRKRENYRRAFDGFDIGRVALYRPARIEKLMADPGIVRNRMKIESAVTNAKAVMAIREEFGSFDAFLWQFVGGQPIRNEWTTYRNAPAKTPQSDTLSKALLARGCKFVGSTIMYAFMQAVGMVDDHETACIARTR